MSVRRLLDLERERNKSIGFRMFPVAIAKETKDLKIQIPQRKDCSMRAIAQGHRPSILL